MTLVIENKRIGQPLAAIRHHAQSVEPAALAIVEELVTGWITLPEYGEHTLYQSRTGPASFGIYLHDGRCFHFRFSHEKSVIMVMDSYRKGNCVAELGTPDDVKKFFKSIRPTKAKATIL